MVLVSDGGLLLSYLSEPRLSRLLLRSTGTQCSGHDVWITVSPTQSFIQTVQTWRKFLRGSDCWRPSTRTSGESSQVLVPLQDSLKKNQASQKKFRIPELDSDIWVLSSVLLDPQVQSSDLRPHLPAVHQLPPVQETHQHREGNVAHLRVWWRTSG